MSATHIAATLTIAIGQAIEVGTSQESFLGALKGAYESPERASLDDEEKEEPLKLAVTMAHEENRSLEDLVDTAKAIWEAVEAEGVDAEEGQEKQ